MWFELFGGFRIELNSRRFEFFVTAGGSVKALGSLSGRLIGLLIIEYRPAARRRARVRQQRDPGHRGHALARARRLARRRRHRDLRRRGLLRVRGQGQDHAEHDAARARVQRPGLLPRGAAGRLPVADPDLRVHAEPHRRRRAGPDSTGTPYVQGNLSGLDHAVPRPEAVGLPVVQRLRRRTCGSRARCSGEIQYVGASRARSTCCSWTAGPHIVGRATLAVSAGGAGTCRSAARCWSRSTRRAATTRCRRSWSRRTTRARRSPTTTRRSTS